MSNKQKRFDARQWMDRQLDMRTRAVLKRKYADFVKQHSGDTNEQLLIYEFDCGPQSGWMYSVNGAYPGLGCSDYKLAEGDKILFSFTCDLGEDLGVKYENEK